MNYFIYDNWKAADRDSPMIHKWDCGHCHMGYGKREKAERGQNGVWIGPFKKIEYARDYGILKFGNLIAECNCV
jgi:hypothetical protein